MTEEKDTPIGWTSLEQSKRLVDCGLDAKSADMYYEELTDSYGGRLYKWNLFVGKSLSIEKNLFSFRLGYTVPCWSLGKLIAIARDGYTRFSDVRISKVKETISLVPQYKTVVAPVFEGATDIEAFVGAVVWLLENGYISKKQTNE